MSRYSGKCDVADWFEDREDDIYKYKFYLVGDDTPLDIKTIKDLIPYYPHLVVCGTFNNKSGTVIMSKKSYVEEEQDERLQLILNDIIRYYNRCKRQKVPFSKEDAFEKSFWKNCSYNDAIYELIDRVAKYGKKATYDGIKLHGLFDYYRHELYDEMIRVGYWIDYAKDWCNLD